MDPEGRGVAEAKIEITDEVLVAYVDGELEAGQRALVSATLRRDAALGRRAKEMRLSRDLLREAFPLQPAARVPERIVVAEKRLAAACVQRLRRARPAFAFRWRDAAAAGLICVLAFAAYLGLHPAREPTRQVTTLAQIDPGNPLHQVLESSPSAQLVQVSGDDAAVRAILTFRAKDGRFCREFEILATSGASTGIACREQGEWHVEVLLSADAAPPNSNYYTPAAGSDDAALAEVVERLMHGEPLGVEEEAHALAEGWRTGAAALP
jgi:hypothetical protein